MVFWNFAGLNRREALAYTIERRLYFPYQSWPICSPLTMLKSPAANSKAQPMRHVYVTLTPNLIWRRRSQSPPSRISEIAGFIACSIHVGEHGIW